MFTANTGLLVLLNSSPTVTSTVLTAAVDFALNFQTASQIDYNSWIYLTIPDSVLVLINAANAISCYKTISGVETT